MSGGDTIKLRAALRELNNPSDVRHSYTLTGPKLKSLARSCGYSEISEVVKAIQEQLGTPRSEYFRFSVKGSVTKSVGGVGGTFYMQHYCETALDRECGCNHAFLYQWDANMLGDVHLGDTAAWNETEIVASNGTRFTEVIPGHKDYLMSDSAKDDGAKYYLAKKILLSDGKDLVARLLESMKCEVKQDEYPVCLRFKNKSDYNVEIRLVFDDQKVDIRHGDDYALGRFTLNMHSGTTATEGELKLGDVLSRIKEVGEKIKQDFENESLITATQRDCLDEATLAYKDFGSLFGYTFTRPPFLRLPDVTYKRLFTRKVPMARYLQTSTEDEKTIKEDMLLQSLFYAVGGGADNVVDVLEKLGKLKEIHFVSGKRTYTGEGQDKRVSVLNDDAMWWSSDDSKEATMDAGTVAYVAVYGDEAKISFNCLRVHGVNRIKSSEFPSTYDEQVLSNNCKFSLQIEQLDSFAQEYMKRGGKGDLELPSDLVGKVQNHVNALLPNEGAASSLHKGGVGAYKPPHTRAHTSSIIEPGN